ncbi:aminoglycoside phosphotransferase family protein [Streptomyces sp. NPDC051098]|uniref:phosphotransferase family protein n=1 Tax=Streptomyces sp. NPDC051098 TaxID=3155411 RepID=UPI00342DA18E
MSVVRELALAARIAAHLPGARRPCPACRRDEDVSVLADRGDGVVVRHGEAVAKAHAPGTDQNGHRARLAVASHPLLAGILLPPLPLDARQVHGRPVTAWPYGAPVNPEDPDAAPWEEAAALLARLHRVDVTALPGPLPPMRGPAKVARALARMESVAGEHRAAAVVRRAWDRLPARARDETPSPVGDAPAPRGGTPSPRGETSSGRDALCHGDLHLGQLVRHPAPSGPWLLIDVDDLGVGDPAWDLARPAAWYAAGLLSPQVWQRFLGAYTAEQGPAVPADSDPWPQLDVPARALTVQTAGLSLARAVAERREPDEVDQMMIDACARMADLPPELEFEPPS